MRADERQLLQQLMGQLTSLAALHHRGALKTGKTVEMPILIEKLRRAAVRAGIDDVELTDRVRGKLAKYQRATVKYRAACRAREALAVSSSPQSDATTGSTP